jgi:Flp pilus assembly protein TadD
MKHWTWLATLLSLLGASDLWAQVIIVPPPPTARVVGVAYGPSIGFSYHRHGLRIGGFYGSTYLFDSFGYPIGPYPLAPYGVSTTNVAVSYVLPRQVFVAGDNDLSGVDLDTTPPPWRSPPKAEKLVARRPQREPEQLQVQPAPDKDEERQVVKKKPVPKRVKEAPAKQEEPDGAQLVREGKNAFLDQAYGLAALRFRQAAVVDRANALPRFLLGQALFALGKYREAAVAIQEGLDLDEAWPKKPFQPRRELHKGNEAEFTQQLKDLEGALAKNPENRFFLFLLGYQYWFDGRQKEAAPLFRRARDLAVDPTYIDRFLKALPPAEVAAAQ